MTARQIRTRRALLVLVLLLVAAGVAAGIYINDYYHADATAFSVIETPADTVRVERADGRIAFLPAEPTAGLIFYPGGKVEYEAYAPLMEQCAERGVLCVLLHVRGNLAMLSPNAADGVRELYPEVERWYLGGHSLGGVAAASYAAQHADAFKGLVLLASYSTADLRDSGLRVLSIVGSEDGVLNREKYEEARENLPADAAEVVIEGGVHAGFGSYGVQEGDGEPSIGAMEQTRQTAEAIAEWLAQKK